MGLLMPVFVRWVPQVGVLADLCLSDDPPAQVSEYRDLWHQHATQDARIVQPEIGKVHRLANGRAPFYCAAMAEVGPPMHRPAPRLAVGVLLEVGLLLFAMDPDLKARQP